MGAISNIPLQVRPLGWEDSFVVGVCVVLQRANKLSSQQEERGWVMFPGGLQMEVP